MRGSLSEQSLPGILRRLAAGGKSGILHVSNDDISKRLFLKDGSIVFAGSDDDEERLGEVLVRAGKMKRTDLDLALQVMKETGQSLGKTAVEMGFLSGEELKAQALERMKTVIYSLFQWSDGRYHFEERDALVEEDLAVNLSATEMILEGVRRIEDPELVRRALGDPRAVLCPPQNPLAPYQDGSLSSSVEWILYQANGISTIEDIVRSSPLDESRTLRSIYALVAAGVLEIQGQPSPESLPLDSTRVIHTTASTLSGPTPFPNLAPSAGSVPQRLGRYEVQQIIGRGAMGAVVLAKDPAIDRTVAIKLIQTAVQLNAAELEKYRERFYREAKAAGKLLHPGIVTVFDVGQAEGDVPFIVMEYVRGRTLQEILRSGGLELAESLRIAGDILEALGYAHSQGVVHRDIKPANILITSDGRAKIMDFGIAHVVGSELTQVGEVLGSPNYMAPEQLSKRPVDQRTDLFAFGVVLYRMLTGKLPFTGDSFASIAGSILSEQPTPPQDMDPAVSPALGDIVLRCLAKDPAQRFASALEVGQALDFLESTDRFDPLSVTTHVAPPPSEKSPSTGTPAEAAGPKKDRAIAALRSASSSLARSRNGRLAAAVLVLLAAGLTALSLMRSRPTENADSAGQTADAEAGREPIPQEAAAPAEPGAPESASEPPSPDEEKEEASNPESAPEPSEASLYHEAHLSLERGDLDSSRSRLEALLSRNPGFPGAREMMAKVKEQIKARESAPVAPPPALSDSQLFQEARAARERGALEESKARLEELLGRSPAFPGASELLVEVTDGLWLKTLPIALGAKHSHRIGGCEGTLTLATWGIRYSSNDHEWEWPLDQIRVIEKVDRMAVNLETHEKDVLNMGKPKAYRFALRHGLGDETWRRYQRLVGKR